MSGLALSIEVSGLSHAIAVLNRIGDPSRGREALVMVGGLGEAQTKRRIAQEKRAPDGEAWPAWSPRYARSRHRGQSLLRAEGHLLESVAAEDVSDTEERIGSNLVYAAIQQMGGQPGMPAGAAAIPAREYLGLSDANLAEINSELEGWLGRLVQ